MEVSGSLKEDFFLSFTSPKKEGINEVTFPVLDKVQIQRFKNIYQLAKFPKALNSCDFLVRIMNRKVKIVMFYGAKRSSNVEAYPVSIGTDMATKRG